MTDNPLKVSSSCMLFIFLFLGIPIFSQTTEPKCSHKDSSAQNLVSDKADDLPQPIPRVIDTFKQIGNGVGEEVSKAASKAVKVVNKVVRGDKSSGNK